MSPPPGGGSPHTTHQACEGSIEAFLLQQARFRFRTAEVCMLLSGLSGRTGYDWFSSSAAYMALKSLFLEVLTVLRADRHDEGFYHSTFLDNRLRVCVCVWWWGAFIFSSRFLCQPVRLSVCLSRLSHLLCLPFLLLLLKATTEAFKFDIAQAGLEISIYPRMLGLQGKIPYPA